MTDYNSANAHERDCRLAFEPEDHRYILDGERELRSVTTIIADWFEKFDADYWAARKAPQMGMTPDEVKAMWQRKADEASAMGTRLHAAIESHYLGSPTPLDDKAYQHFTAFTQRYALKPYRTEWAIFDEELGVAGTIDFLEEADGVFTMYDWKRSDKLVNSDGSIKAENPFHKYACRPIHNIPDTPFWHYALQQSMYRFILERRYGIAVSDCRLGVFHPNHSTYHVLRVPYLRDHLIAIFGLNE